MYLTTEGIGIIFFTVVMIGVGYYFSKRNAGDRGEFFLSGRSNGIWMITAGHVMGWVGAGTLVGVYGSSYTGGIAAGIWYPIGFTISFFIFGPIMARRIKRLGDARQVFTFVEIFRRRFSQQTGAVYLVFEEIQACAYVVGQYMSIAIILDLAFGLSYRPACLIAGVIVLVYVALGGLSGSLAVTLIQMGLCVLGLILAVCFGLNATEGFHNLMAMLPADWNANIFAGQTFAGILAGFLPTFFASFIYSTMYIRCYSAKDEKTAVGACYLAGIICAVIVGLTIIGVYLSVAMVPGLESGDYALIELFRAILPWAAAIFAAAIVSACMSTASESVMLVSTVITNDVARSMLKIKMTEKGTIWFARGVMVVFTVIVCVVAMFMSSVLSLMYYSSTILASCVPAFLIALWWNRVNWQGMLAGFVGGGVTSIVWPFIPVLSGLMNSMYAGMAVSVIAMLIFTFACKPPTAENIHFIQPFQTKNYDPDPLPGQEGEEPMM